MANLKIQKGQKFNFLTIIKEVDRGIKPSGQVYRRFLCSCDCGKKTIKTLHKITSGHTKSCGCYHDLAHKTHGMTNTQIYEAWSHMKQRCDNPKDKMYKHYGARGITYCNEWEKFENFYKDMKNGWEKGLYLDRIDNNGNYHKENCRWVNAKISANNTRHNRTITIDGESLNIRQWEEKMGFNRNTIHSRLKNGWSEQDAVLTPLKFIRKK